MINNLQFSQRKSEVLIRISSIFQPVSAMGVQASKRQGSCLFLFCTLISGLLDFMFT